MSAPAALVLGFGLGALITAPLTAPIGIWLFERHLAREGLREWMRR